MTFLEKIWILLSQTLNVVCGGDPDESLSARVFREQRVRWVNFLDKILGQGHCGRVLYFQEQRQRDRLPLL